MNYGEIKFNMKSENKPTISKSDYFLKRWRKYSIYAQSGSYNRTDNPTENLYSTCSTYLYDYVVVSEQFFKELIYTEKITNTDPGSIGEYPPNYQWTHYPYTFKGTPNLKTNNYVLTSSAYIGGLVNKFVYDTLVYLDGDFFEIVGSYPKNHLLHKRIMFSADTIESINKNSVKALYKKSSQSISTTIGQNGIEDGSSPVYVSQVTNINLIQGDNVINK